MARTQTAYNQQHNDLFANAQAVNNSDNAYSQALGYLRSSGIVDSSVNTDYERDLLASLGGTIYQNQYNDPSKQFERLVAAGISPFAAAQAVASSGSTSASVDGVSSHEEGYEQQRANLFLNAFMGAFGIAKTISGIVNESSQTAFNFSSLPARLQSLDANNTLLGKKSGLVTQQTGNALNSNWLGALQNSALSKQVFGDGSYNGIGVGMFTRDLSPTAIKGLTDYWQNYYQTQLSELKGEDLRYRIDNILPKIFQKYSLSNDQQQYIMEMMKAIPPEIQGYITFGLSIMSALSGAFGKFIP